MASVHLRGTLKGRASDRAEHEVGGAKLGELLRELERSEPGLEGWILDERGRIRRHINVFVNGERGSEDTAVGGDDRVEVLPAISGG
jgi:molybdopterin converting factor small subunit